MLGKLLCRIGEQKLRDPAACKAARSFGAGFWALPKKFLAKVSFLSRQNDSVGLAFGTGGCFVLFA